MNNSHAHRGSHAYDVDSADHVLFLGAVISVVLDGDATDGTLAVTEIAAPAGYENNLHAHPPGELFYVLDGEMTLYVDGEASHLTPGTFGYVPPNRPHGFRTVGEETLRVLAMFAPAGMVSFFREVGTAVDTPTPPAFSGPTDEELARMADSSPKFGIERLGPLPAAE